MFNNNINKPAITVFLPLTSAKTSFCQWQKLVLPGRSFPRKKTVEKTVFFRSLAKTCQPCLFIVVVTAVRGRERLAVVGVLSVTVNESNNESVFSFQRQLIT